MSIQVKTISVNGRDWDEIDRELGRALRGLEAPGGSQVFQVETVETRTTEVSGQHGLGVTVRAYFRNDSVDF